MFILGCNIIEKSTVWNPDFLNTQMAEIIRTQGIHIQYLDALLFLRTSKTGQPHIKGWYTSAPPPTNISICCHVSCCLLVSQRCFTSILLPHASANNSLHTIYGVKINAWKIYPKMPLGVMLHTDQGLHYSLLNQQGGYFVNQGGNPAVEESF